MSRTRWYKNSFCFTDPFWVESTGHHRIANERSNNAGLWYSQMSLKICWTNNRISNDLGSHDTHFTTVPHSWMKWSMTVLHKLSRISVKNLLNKKITDCLIGLIGKELNWIISQFIYLILWTFERFRDAPLIVCEGNPPVTDGFPSQIAIQQGLLKSNTVSVAAITSTAMQVP